MTALWYPEQPAEGEEPLPAPVQVVTHPVVTTTPRLLPGELGPEASYGSLWHFRGTLTNRRTAEKLSPATKDVSWLLDNGGLVMGLDPTTVLRGTGLSELNAIAQSFTFSWSINPGVLDADVVAWQTLNEKNEPLVQFVMGARNRPFLRLYSAPGIFQEVGGQFSLPEDRISQVNLSFIPLEKDWQVSWSLNGITKQTGKFVESKGLPKSLGGVAQEWRGPMVWDEFGVYLRNAEGVPSLDAGVFQRAMKNLHGTELLFAESFDGLAPPPGWELPGPPFLSLPLPAQDVVLSPPVSLEAGTYVVQMANAETLWDSLAFSALDSEGNPVGKTVKSATDQTTVEWTSHEPVLVRFEWKNIGTEVVSLDELAIFRKME